jgi:transcriptional regulator with XRE-family HTH domain
MEWAIWVRSLEPLGRMPQWARLLLKLIQRRCAKRLGTTQRYIWGFEPGKPSIAMQRLFTSPADCNITLTASVATIEDRNG